MDAGVVDRDFTGAVGDYARAAANEVVGAVAFHLQLEVIDGDVAVTVDGNTDKIVLVCADAHVRDASCIHDAAFGHIQNGLLLIELSVHYADGGTGRFRGIATHFVHATGRDSVIFRQSDTYIAYVLSGFQRSSNAVYDQRQFLTLGRGNYGSLFNCQFLELAWLFNKPFGPGADCFGNIHSVSS